MPAKKEGPKWDSSLLLDETGNQISVKIRCREDLVSPSHHLKSADHWLLLSSSLCLQSYSEKIFSPSQSCRAPDVLLWSPIPRTESVPGQWSSACRRTCVRSCCCCFFLFCFREFQITSDFKNWCRLLIADLPCKERIESPCSVLPQLKCGAWHNHKCTHTGKMQRMLRWSGAMSLPGAPILLTSSHSFLSLLPSIVGRKKF